MNNDDHGYLDPTEKSLSDVVNAIENLNKHLYIKNLIELIKMDNSSFKPSMEDKTKLNKQIKDYYQNSTHENNQKTYTKK